MDHIPDSVRAFPEWLLSALFSCRNAIAHNHPFVILFSAFMVIGRLVAGVHWLTDIVGSVLLSAGLYALYRAAVLAMEV